MDETKTPVKKELVKYQKYFEDAYLKGTCFKDLDDLINDRTTPNTNAYRCLLCMKLMGVWEGLGDTAKQ